ncbi:hypothetical protein [Vibrio jasicida]|uniref:hypothetical protein n=1 Tax=Vibrio jasicida TaxID=766224 RepID=UPI0005EE9D51|nr:hypothetical protein [Vibrio jasicida]
MNISNEIIALWGAGLSTLLAVVKLWELWIARRRVEISYGFVGDPEIGNDIIIRNLSSTPIIISYWELLFCERNAFGWKIYRNENPAEDTCDLCIASHSSKKINFSGSDYFQWNHKALDGKRLYFKFHIAGKRRPIKHLLYKG